MPLGPALFGFGGGDLEPIDRQQAANIARIERKYTSFAPILAQLPPELTQSIMDVDSDRVARGAPPLSDTQTAKALQSALSGKPYTPPAERGFGPRSLPGNVLSDLGSMLKSIPRLPMALVNEVRDIPNISDRIAENQAEGMNTLAAVLNAPGVRMIPGAYIAGEVAQGTEGLKELARHPLFTVLDALPLAGKAAELTKVGQLGKEAQLAAGRPAGASALKALATKTIDDAGELAPNALSRGMATVRDSTRAGRALDEAFGGRARWVSRQRDLQTARMQAVLGGMQAPADRIEQAAQDSVKLAAEYQDWAPDKMADLTRRLELGDYDGLGAEELAFVSKVRDLNARYADHLVDTGESVRIGGEVYDGPTGRQLQRQITRRERTAEMNFARAQVVNPTMAPADYLEAAQRWAGSDLPRAERSLRVRAALEALDGQGYNVADLRRLEQQTRRGGTWTDLQQALDARLADVANGGQLPQMTPQQAASGVRKARRDRFLSRDLAGFDDKAVARNAKKADRALAKAVPARFQPLVQETVRRRLIEQQTALVGTADEAERIANAIIEKRWRDVPGWDEQADKAYRGLQREVRQTWMDMRAAGIDPEFVHTVNPDRIASVAGPTADVTRPGLSQSKARGMDASPGVRDPAVALSHQGVEFLRRRAAEDLVDLVARKYGMTEADLRDAYLPAARARAQMQPLLDAEGHLQRAIGREWTRFDPLSGVGWGSSKLEALGQEQLWLPKSVANSMRRLNDPRSPMGAVLDPVSKTFRMAVIGLSPRTQLYNVLGGATMTAMRTGPSVLRYAEDAWKMAKDPTVIPQGELRAMMGAQSRNMEGLASRTAVAATGVPGQGALAFLGGRTMRRLWDQAQQAKTAAAPATGLLGKAVDASMEWNARIDNFYRAMTYLYGENRAKRLGVADDVAERAGLELARKTLADWSAMTPFERGVMRSIVPFYGFQAHALRYIFSYPMDHPLRAEVLGKVGQAELDDLNDTLPTKFLGTFFLGGQGNGKRTGINLAAVNPFGDVANMMTLAGFLGSTNPVIQTVLESVGVDFGTAELYPTLRYDPASGRLTGAHDNPLAAFAENVIPQTRIVTSLMGANQEFNERLRLDPTGAWQQLASSGGIPIVWKTYDLGGERIKTEIARQDSADDVLNDALKSGNWSEALRYPSLRAAYEQLDALPAEARPAPVNAGQVRTIAATTGGI